VNAISRSQLNGGFGAGTGPYRDDSCTRAFHPFLPFNIGAVSGREAQESGLRLKASVAPKAAVVRQVLCGRKADIRCFSTQRQSHRLRFRQCLPERVLPLNPVLNQLQDIDPEHAHCLPIRRSDECPFPLGAGTEKHGPDFRSTPHRGSFGNWRRRLRLSLSGRRDAALRMGAGRRSEHAVVGQRTHDPVEIMGVPRADEPVEHGLALGVAAILQLPRIRRMPLEARRPRG
jgi:hypothetical protein